LHIGEDKFYAKYEVENFSARKKLYAVYPDYTVSPDNTISPNYSMYPEYAVYPDYTMYPESTIYQEKFGRMWSWRVHNSKT